MFLLNTDAVSELEKPKIDAGFRTWIESVDWLDVHLSVISIGEIWQGIVELTDGPKRRRLEGVFNLIPDRFHNRVIPVDWSIAKKYGEIQAEFGPLPSIDTLIAATAITRRLTLVTHNVKDMSRTGATILDPWST
jgi:toxin FitB